ncbi:MAG TPA: alpha/beta hydrolase [Bacteroidales bacterium]|nr:alpha/beta hydrolase [Bacteroidales bacterium]
MKGCYSVKIKLLNIFFLINIGLICHAQPAVIKLWPQGIPGAIANRMYKERIWYVPGKTYYGSVTNPDITIYKAPEEKSNGTVVIICPGGAYTRLAVTSEGADVAAWLNRNGITAVVLKYRLPSDSIMTDKSIAPLQDAMEAIRIIRRNAKELGIDTAKVGILGFSAGGHLASTLATHYNEKVYNTNDKTSARPDFEILVYPVISMMKPETHPGSRINLLGASPDTTQVLRFSNQLHVTANTPPAFIVHSSDDKTVPVKNSIDFFESLVKNNVIAEMHIFQSGGHGYGLAKGKKDESEWPELCLHWLKENKFIQ